MWCQLSSLAANGWIAEEPERWDRTSAYKGTLLLPLQSMFWSHLVHPNQWRHKSDRPWHRGLRPLLFSNNVAGSFTSASNYSTRTGRRQAQRLNVTAQRRDHLNWERSFTASIISLAFFKDLDWWSGQGLNSRSPAQQTGLLPTELTDWLCWLGLIPENSDSKRLTSI